MILIAYLWRPCLVLLIACGVAIVALKLSSTRLHLLERDGWQLFGELFSWLVAKGGVGISIAQIIEKEIKYAVALGSAN